MSVYPIPANNKLNLQLSSQEGTMLRVYGFDVDGKMVLNQSISASGNISLDVSHLLPGWYNFILTDDTKVQGSHKVLISH